MKRQGWGLGCLMPLKKRKRIDKHFLGAQEEHALREGADKQHMVWRASLDAHRIYKRG